MCKLPCPTCARVNAFDYSETCFEGSHVAAAAVSAAALLIYCVMIPLLLLWKVRLG